MPAWQGLLQTAVEPQFLQASTSTCCLSWGITVAYCPLLWHTARYCAGDVYYFCGSRMQYCTCSYRWNLAGWGKAAVLWAFVLSTAFGVQRLLVELVLQGLLPGELQ